MESSSTLFDFDALDNAEVEPPSLPSLPPAVDVVGLLSGKEKTCCNGHLSPAKAAASTDDGDTEDDVVEDDVSEVWPGEIVGDVSMAFSDRHEDVEHKEALEASWDDYSVPLWEVVFTRVVVRTQPSLDAPVAGICSQGELVAEQLDHNNPDWVNMAEGLGYILKDGRKKDPSLGILLQPFQLRSVPSPCRGPVSRLLKDAWVEARGHSPILKPQLVRSLRKAYDDSVSVAASAPYHGGANRFDVDAFADALLGEVRQLLNAERESVPRQVAPPEAPVGGAFKYRQPLVGGAGCRVTLAVVREMMASMKQHVLPCVEDVVSIISEATLLFGDQASLVELRVPAASTLHVVGDIHGQYWDLLHMIEEFGEPSNSNLYLFNGDFVDRGRFSVEVAISLLAMKVAAPHSVHLNRGNHESMRMNAIYGFMAEVKQKYDEEVFSRFCQAFRCLPLATVVNDSVFVVHGGLGSVGSIRLEDIALLNRQKEPDENADELMLELLWSDPMESPGLRKSPRGGGVLFGPDVTQRFCSDNGLVCVVRSHEMKQDGFEWHHEKMCLTIFSAPNYCGICGNLGAVCDIKPRNGQHKLALSDMKVRTFEATDHLKDVPSVGFF